MIDRIGKGNQDALDAHDRASLWCYRPRRYGRGCLNTHSHAKAACGNAVNFNARGGRRVPRSSTALLHVLHESAEHGYRSERRELALEAPHTAPEHRLIAVNHGLAERALDGFDRLNLRGVGAAQENAVGLGPV